MCGSDTSMVCVVVTRYEYHVLSLIDTTHFTDTASSGDPMLSALNELTSAAVGGKSEFPVLFLFAMASVGVVNVLP